MQTNVVHLHNMMLLFGAFDFMMCRIAIPLRYNGDKDSPDYMLDGNFTVHLMDGRLVSSYKSFIKIVRLAIKEIYREGV